MFFIDTVFEQDEGNLRRAAEALTEEDIPTLLGLLSEKDDKIRYKAFLLAKTCSEARAIVYPHWETLREKLTSGNSYQRSLGAMLIAENAKWDTKNLMEDTIDTYCRLFADEKPITARQSIQALLKIIPYHGHLCHKIAERLMAVDLMSIKDTMRKLVLTDILHALTAIKKSTGDNSADVYIMNALTGGILDKKTAKAFADKGE